MTQPFPRTCMVLAVLLILARAQALSQSGSSTPSAAQTHTGSSSQAPSASGTASLTSSPSMSPSSTSSTSPRSASITPTTTASNSQTPSLTASITCTPTSSETPSVTQTSCATPTPTLSQTPSQTPSLTQSITPSSTATGSITTSLTPSLTRTQTPSLTQTASQSQSTSQTSTTSQTQSPSQTQSASNTVTPSGSGTHSGTITPSQTQTPSLTQSPSETETASQSGTASETHTPSQTQSASHTATPSASGTRSVSGTHSQTQSPSQTQTQTQSASITHTPSQTQSSSPTTTSSQSGTASQSGTSSQTQSATQTLTSDPFALFFEPWKDFSVPPFTPEPPIRRGSVAPALVSDSLPILYTTLWLSRCPEPTLMIAGDFRVNCSATRDAPVGGTTQTIFIAVHPSINSALPLDLSSACSAAQGRAEFRSSRVAQQVNVPVAVAVSPALGTGSGPALLRCTLTAAAVQDRVMVATASFPLFVQGTHWPLAADAFVIPPGSTNTMTQSLYGLVNTTSANSFTKAAHLCGRAPTYPDGIFAACVLAAAQATWDSVALPNVTSISTASLPSAFNVSLTSSTLVLLRAFSDLLPAFFASTTVTLGGEPCMVIAASSDGAWLAFYTPNASTMCGPSGASAGLCDSNALVITSPSGPDTGFREAKLVCPPFCPGDLPRLRWGGSIAQQGAITVPFPVDVNGTSFLPALQPSIASGEAVFVPLTDPDLVPRVQYSHSCADDGFTDPNSGSCNNVSDAASYLCAYGSGTTCSLCPSNGLCPGGQRLWPRAGYFTFSETDANLQKCDDPDASTRCVGWDADVGVTICGVAYRQGSYLCEACADGYYPASDGTCAACPLNSSTWDRFKGLVFVFISVVVTVLVVFILLSLLVRRYGGSLERSTVHAGNLFVWSVKTVQVIAQVAAVTSSSLPPFLAWVFSYVRVGLSVASSLQHAPTSHSTRAPAACGCKSARPGFTAIVLRILSL